MDLGLHGRVYLVTGGSRGLGFAAAQALFADGARVVLSAPHEGTASSGVARLAQNAAAAEPAAWVIADNADPATPGRLIAAARDRFGRLDGAVISVGGSPSGTVATTTDEAWRSAFESVFLGAVWPARILAEDLGGVGDGRPTGGSVTGAGGSIVFVLASSVRVPLAELAISNGLKEWLAAKSSTQTFVMLRATMPPSSLVSCCSNSRLMSGTPLSAWDSSCRTVPAKSAREVLDVLNDDRML